MAAQAEFRRQQRGRQSDGVTVARIDRLRQRRLAEHLFREGAAEDVAGEDRRLFGGQNDVAEYYADTAAVEAARHAGSERLPTGEKRQVKDGIEAGESRSRARRKVVEEVAAA